MKQFNQVEDCVEETLRTVGPNIILGTPLGIGKPNQLLNAFFQRAKNDPKINLTILTALSLNKPTWKSDLERRFKEPIAERLYGDYPDLNYLTALSRRNMPANISVFEFYIQAGHFLHNPLVQRHYVSSNYTHAARDALRRGINVFAQMVSAPDGKGRYSLSCNADLSLDLIPMIQAQRSAKKAVAILGQVNARLPYMPGRAAVPAEFFDQMVIHPRYDFEPFTLPRMAVSAPDYAIGFHAASHVRDGGTLQLGIGTEAEAVAYFLILRHQRSARYARLVGETGILAPVETTPFSEGLYASTEMLMPAFLNLIEAKVVSRLTDGALMHAGFFIGDRAFYENLRKMPAAEKDKIQMTAISYVNELYGDEEKKRRERPHARFINSGMMVTLTGGAVSDTLDDHQIVSGVGGQYNFVAMAHALENARSILMIHATRNKNGETSSNIVWDHGAVTIPHHLRDIVVTEYGSADLRGRSDEETIQALLNICDSRFQADLLAKAKHFGKVAEHYEIPAAHRNNTPVRIHAFAETLKKDGLCPDCPFGSDLTPEEIALAKALPLLQALQHHPHRGFSLLAKARHSTLSVTMEDSCLERLHLLRPRSLGERFLRRLVGVALRAAH